MYHRSVIRCILIPKSNFLWFDDQSLPDLNSIGTKSVSCRTRKIASIFRLDNGSVSQSGLSSKAAKVSCFGLKPVTTGYHDSADNFIGTTYIRITLVNWTAYSDETHLHIHFIRASGLPSSDQNFPL